MTTSGRLATSDLLGIAFQIGDGTIRAVMISTNAWRGVALLLSAAPSVPKPIGGNRFSLTLVCYMSFGITLPESEMCIGVS